jgi:hypothetical protein
VAARTAAAAGRLTSRANTNLEDISDWLTKTFVGVGLTQLFAVPHYLWQVAGQFNSHGFGWENHGQLLALALLLYFGPGGFWLGYVGTRTILTALLDEFARSNERANLENLHLRIRDRAYAIWEQEGRPAGKEREHWARAEAEVEAEELRTRASSFHGATSESYIWRIANLMLKRYGDQARAETTRRADELEAAGDHAGAAVSRRVIDAVG